MHLSSWCCFPSCETTAFFMETSWSKQYSRELWGEIRFMSRINLGLLLKEKMIVLWVKGQFVKLPDSWVAASSLAGDEDSPSLRMSMMVVGSGLIAPAHLCAVTKHFTLRIEVCLSATVGGVTLLFTVVTIFHNSSLFCMIMLVTGIYSASSQGWKAT